MRTNGWVSRLAVALAMLTLALAGCVKDGDNGSQGGAGPQGPPEPINTVLDRFTPLPGLNFNILAVTGATGTTGNFAVGDTIAVTFTFTLDDGTEVPIDEVDYGAIYVSGPATNYQRVLVRQTDLLSAAVENANGSYTYTFANPIPTVYEPPYNDTAFFGAGDGELAGQALLDGTYTIGLEAYKEYTIETEAVRDAANAVYDFLLGTTAVAIDTREVVTTANCNRCHSELQMHRGTGEHHGIRRDVRLCVLCHTSGAEDTNDPLVYGGTPGVSLDFRVMIHKIHNGEHLPSVLGVGTVAGGTRNYSATPQPLLYADGDEVEDFSEVGFPVWPNLNIAMPRDLGFTALTGAQQTLENTMRMGVTDCEKCHGDPDGSGPLPEPADGDLHHDQPSRRACGACHDDVDWSLDYKANELTMTPQPDDSSCATGSCHPAMGTALAIEDAHLHPLLNSTQNPGLNFGVTDVVDTDLDGLFEVGERIQFQFTLTDDATPTPNDVGSQLNSCSIVMSGPVENRNLLVSSSLPTWDPDGAGPLVATVPASIIGAGPNYVVNMPQAIFFDRKVVPAGLVLNASRTPIWCDDNTNWSSAARTSIRERTGTTVRTTLAAAAVALQRYVDVASTAGFVANDWLMLDVGTGFEEYVQIPLIQGNRLWLSAPLQFAHASGSAADEAAFATRAGAGVDWTISNYATSEITCDGVDLINGDVIIISYLTDFLMPSVFQPNFNDSPDIDATWGDWVGLPLMSGTYQIGIWGYINRDVVTVSPTPPTPPNETTTYRGTSNPSVTDVLVDSPTDPTPTELTTYSLIPGNGDTCMECHNHLYLHGGGRHGFDTCILCHGTPGEDRATYARLTASATTGALMQFRQMLHRIHRGEGLSNDSYGIEGNSSISYFNEIEFPDMPGGVADCEKCHGEGNEAYHQPDDTENPSQTLPRRAWRTICTSCHDDSSVAGHVDLMTSASGQESCGVCHGPGQEYEVETMHRQYTR